MSPEEIHLLITQKIGGRNRRDNMVLRIISHDPQASQKYPILYALYNNGVNMDNITRNDHTPNRLLTLCEGVKKYNYFEIGHNLDKGVDALTDPTNQFVEFNWGSNRTQYSEYLDKLIDGLFEQGLIEVTENPNIDPATGRQPEPDIDFPVVETQEVKNAFPKGRYAMVQLTDGTYYKADVDSLYKIMLELNKAYGGLNAETLKIKLGDKKNAPVFHFSPDRNTQITIRNVFSQEDTRTFERQTGHTQNPFDCRNGNVIDFVEDGKKRRIICLHDRIVSDSSEIDLSNEEIVSAYEKALSIYYGEDVLQVHKLREQIDNLKAQLQEKDELLAAKTKENVGMSNGFWSRFKSTKIGSMLFGNKNKALDAAKTKEEHTKDDNNL